MEDPIFNPHQESIPIDAVSGALHNVCKECNCEDILHRVLGQNKTLQGFVETYDDTFSVFQLSDKVHMQLLWHRKEEYLQKSAVEGVDAEEGSTVGYHPEVQSTEFEAGAKLAVENIVVRLTNSAFNPTNRGVPVRELETAITSGAESDSFWNWKGIESLTEFLMEHPDQFTIFKDCEGAQEHHVRLAEPSPWADMWNPLVDFKHKMSRPQTSETYENHNQHIDALLQLVAANADAELATIANEVLNAEPPDSGFARDQLPAHLLSTQRAQKDLGLNSTADDAIRCEQVETFVGMSELGGPKAGAAVQPPTLRDPALPLVSFKNLPCQPCWGISAKPSASPDDTEALPIVAVAPPWEQQQLQLESIPTAATADGPHHLPLETADEADAAAEPTEGDEWIITSSLHQSDIWSDARDSKDQRGAKPDVWCMEQLAQHLSDPQQADQALCNLIVKLLEDKDFNPDHGSVMIEKLRSILMKDNRHKDLIQKALGDRTFADFIASQSHLFRTITLPNRRSRVHYIHHVQWKSADACRLREQQQHRDTIKATLWQFLVNRPYHRCTVQEFIKEYGNREDCQPPNRELRAGDFVRMVKQFGDVFYYDANAKPSSLIYLRPEAAQQAAMQPFASGKVAAIGHVPSHPLAPWMYGGVAMAPYGDNSFWYDLSNPYPY
eukprot:GGOE01062870.1.p1 GENE.GGOE01062870.1~~GGOE01062870.1.p1  ORF type:complete len:668 (+),score=155.13 GGOE01062870.1:1047-3050(+)